MKDTYHHLPTAILRISETGIIQEANDTAALLFGEAIDKLIGQAFPSRTNTPELQEKIQAICDTPEACEIHIIRADQSTTPIRLQAKSEGNSCWLNLQDISLYRQLQRALEARTNHFDAIIQTAVDGIITINERGIIEFLNPAAAALFEYEAEELIGKNISALMPEPDHSHHDSYLSNYRHTGHAKIIGIGRNVLGLKKSGRTFPFRLSVSEVQLEGRRVFTGIVHDISKEKENEEKIRKLNAELEQRVAERTEKHAEAVNRLLETNQALQEQIRERELVEQALRQSEQKLRTALAREKELNKLKSRFVSTASHEFRTPLSTILSSASLIGRYQTTETQAKREKHIERIKSSVNNLNAILHDFLSLSKLEEGRLNHKAEIISLCALGEEVVAEMRAVLKEGQQVAFTCDAPGQFKLASSLLRNSLINLLSNATKYSQDTIDLTMRVVNNMLYVSVRDRGIGIPASEQPLMFTRFFRAANATHIQGTGLGLNIVKRYVELMQGNISFESTEGKGSTFMLEIPVESV